MSLENIASCPICGGQSFQMFLQCTDFTTTKEAFHIQHCTSCSFLMTNPRPTESGISKYYLSNSYISHNARPKSILDLIYFLARKFSLRWKMQLIRKYKVSGNFLDYGCGTGEFLNTCSVSGWSCQGIEPSEQAREIAEQRTGLKIFTHSQNLIGQKFDVITLWHVLEHIHGLVPVLGELKRMLNEDGIILIAVPNYMCNDADCYKEHWAGYDVPRHLWHFSKSTMERLLKNNGLKIKSVEPMKLDAFYVSLLSEKYKAGGMNSISGLFRGFYRGLVSNLKARSTNNYSSLIYICTLS